MDREEEEGLRAFGLTVGCHAGASYPERPLWVERDGQRTDVAEVETQWREQDRVGFRLRLADGATALVYYVPELDLWSGVLYSGGASEMKSRGPAAGQP
ncbi:MAG: hypothetical protein WEC75_01240 [Dehalococcoidia bacterium]